jgi:hypothetical protein
MKRKLIDVKIVRIDGDACYLKYTLDYGNYLRRISDTYSLTSGKLTKELLTDDGDFLPLFERAMNKYESGTYYGRQECV